MKPRPTLYTDPLFRAAAPGEFVCSVDNGGSGYGDPLTREPERVLGDVVEGYVTRNRAKEVYGIVPIGSPADGTLAVDQTTTEACRAALAARGAVPPPNACRIGQG